MDFVFHLTPCFLNFISDLWYILEMPLGFSELCCPVKVFKGLKYWQKTARIQQCSEQSSSNLTLIYPRVQQDSGSILIQLCCFFMILAISFMKEQCKITLQNIAHNFLIFIMYSYMRELLFFSFFLFSLWFPTVSRYEYNHKKTGTKY